MIKLSAAHAPSGCRVEEASAYPPLQFAAARATETSDEVKKKEAGCSGDSGGYLRRGGGEGGNEDDEDDFHMSSQYPVGAVAVDRTREMQRAVRRAETE